MRHCGTHTIETERLILRPLTLDDAEPMFHNWAGDPDVTRYLRWDYHTSWTVTYEYLYLLEKEYQKPTCYQWGITEKVTGILMGTISIQPAELDSEWLEMGLDPDNLWEPGYALGTKWWGRGYALEALRAVCEYWFQNTDSRWLVACHHCDNLASGQVLQRAGFLLDHAAVYHKFDGTPVDCDTYFLDGKDFLRPAGVLPTYEE